MPADVRLPSLMSLGDGESLSELFDVSCLTNTFRLTSYICEQHTQRMLGHMAQYDLRDYHLELVQIAQSLGTNDAKRDMCDTMIHYIRRTGDSSATLDTVFDFCDTERKEDYARLRNLLFANTVIQNYTVDTFSHHVYNEYIIHSIIQSLYNDIRMGVLSEVNLGHFESMWSALLADNAPISQLTIDMSALVYQSTIIPALSNQSLTARLDSAQVSSIQQRLKRMYEGDARRDVVGLGEKVSD
jgi:hypothetical protein